MVHDYSYSRRCINCWFDKRFSLPRLTKKVIYLDQFVISNMMKELDDAESTPRSRSHAGFYLELFETLDRVCKLQLAVCPDSSIHNLESVVVEASYGKLRSVFRHLSYGVSLRRPDVILHSQTTSAFEAWIRGEDIVPAIKQDWVLEGKIDAWTDKIRIDLNYTVPGLAKELRASAEARTEHLIAVCQGWKDAPDLSLKQVFEQEVRNLGASTLEVYARYLSKYILVSKGMLPVSEISFHPPEVSLIHQLQSICAKSGLQKEEAFVKIREFFTSKDYRKVPFAKIQGLFWMTLARAVRSGMSPDNYPRGSIYNDLDVVSAYSPYCDAMFVDKEVEHLSRQGDLGRYLKSGAKFFSLRNKDDFLTYLRDLERSAAPEHLQLVREVYGSDAGRPFLELLKYREKSG